MKTKKLNIKFMYNGIKIDGTLHKGFWSKGGYIKPGREDWIQFYSRGYKPIPNFGAIKINNTDIGTDYFETDSIIFNCQSPYYCDALKAYLMQQERRAKQKK
jgi:hypothetical protein